MFAIAITAFTLASAQRSPEDLMVLDNTEPIVRYGLDSTGSWWAVTQPFNQLINVYINGRRYGPFSSAITPKFSADGSTWTFAFVRDLQAYVRTPRGEQPITAESVVGVSYAPLNPVPWVEYNLSDARMITDGTRTYTTTNAIGFAQFNPTGTVVWHTARRGSQVALVRNGIDNFVYDEILLTGVWSDARPVFAARIGSSWTVFVGEQEIEANLQRVLDLTVNAFGTVLAFNGARSGSPANSYMYTDEYRNAWSGPNLDVANDLVLSPCCDLIAVTGIMQGGARVVMFNSANYPAGAQSSIPSFSYDGAHMAFVGNDGEGFVSMDGKRNTVKGGGIATSSRVAVSPTGRSVAWASGSTLVVYDIVGERMGLGKMCDTMGTNVIFNRRTSEYQALGVFGGRLFLLSSPAP